ncbi:MAG: thermonuclease family protein [Pseudomonadales bacterium]
MMLAVTCCFHFLWTTSAYGQSDNCPANGNLQWATLNYIVDGDTLHLTDGRKVRVIAINTPELGREHRSAQPLADKARGAVKAFFASDAKVGLQLGVDDRDRHGRVLAHVFRSDGGNLAAFMLARGLAWHIVIPPNDRYGSCLADKETLAQQQSLGIWHNNAYSLKEAKTLQLSDSGFQRVQGTVESVTRSRNGWWLQLGQLAVRVRDKDLHNLEGFDPRQLKNTSLLIRGWIVDRSQSTAVQQKGYSPLMMDLRHSAMLK